MKLFPILLLLSSMGSCALDDNWEQARQADDAYRACLERHDNDPSLCADHRAGARQTQERYEEQAQDVWGNPGEYPRP